MSNIGLAPNVHCYHTPQQSIHRSLPTQDIPISLDMLLRLVRTLALLLAPSVLHVAGADLSGYTTTTAAAASTSATISNAYKTVDTAVRARDWTAARAAWTAATGGLSLQNVGVLNREASDVFETYSAYYGSPTYAQEFVDASLNSDTGAYKLLEGKPREEMAMKGIALQSVMMGAVNSLYTAVRKCADGSADAPQYVDTAWALFASEKGPIALGEKRCPQFNTCTTASAAGKSSVNVRLLAAFKKAQSLATTRGSSCWELRSTVEGIVGLMYVPVLQGMMREAYEVDPVVHGRVGGDDGFVEVCEGWAFTRAVLPRIAACSSSAAATIRANMDTVVTGKPHVKDGYVAVAKAVESTYACLSITCADVGAMVGSDSKYLWAPCEDGKARGAPASQTIAPPTKDVPGPSRAQGDVDGSWLNVGIAFIVISFILAVAAVTFGLFACGRLGSPRNAGAKILDPNSVSV